MRSPPSPFDARGAHGKNHLLIDKRNIENGCTLPYREILHKEKFVSGGQANIYPYTPYQAHPPLQIREFLNFLSKIF